MPPGLQLGQLGGAPGEMRHPGGQLPGHHGGLADRGGPGPAGTGRAPADRGRASLRPPAPPGCPGSPRPPRGVPGRHRPGRFSRRLAGARPGWRRPGRSARPLCGWPGLPAGRGLARPGSRGLARGPLRAARAGLPMPGGRCGQEPGQRGTRRGQIRVGVEDPGLEVAQFPPGFHAELIHEHPAGALVGGQRLGLPAAAVQRQHQLGMETLTPGVIVRQLGQLADQLGVQPAGQPGVHPPFLGLHPQRVQPRHLGRDEHVGGHVHERVPAPQADRLAQQFPRSRAAARGASWRMASPPLPHKAVKHSASTSSGSASRA